MDSGTRQHQPRILVVDDEAFIREAVEVFLHSENFEVFTADCGEKALEVLERVVVDIALLDIRMPGMDGITLLGEIKKLRPDIEVVMASGCGTIESAVQAMRMGAYDYITKPILDFEEDLLKVVDKALERRRLLVSNRRLAADVQEANRELKKSNSELKRHITSFEILSETSRLVGDLEVADAVFDLTIDTLTYQFEVSSGLLIVQTERGLQLGRSVGLGGRHERILESPLFDPNLVDPHFFQESDQAQLRALLDTLEVAEQPPLEGVLIPLRARGEPQGYLIVLEHDLAAAGQENRIRFMSLLAAQVAAPLALFKERVAQ